MADNRKCTCGHGRLVHNEGPPLNGCSITGCGCGSWMKWPEEGCDHDWNPVNGGVEVCSKCGQTRYDAPPNGGYPEPGVLQIPGEIRWQKLQRPIDYIEVNGMWIGGDQITRAIHHDTDMGTLTVTFVNVKTLHIEYKEHR